MLARKEKELTSALQKSYNAIRDFKIMNDTLSEVNEELDIIIEKRENEIMKLQAEISVAKEQQENNYEIMSRIKGIIGGQYDSISTL